ncbi:Aminodeoxychorismate synthase, component I [Hyella patelloides LEGE 07179]|uniref:Aminodeoxychorismate synthase, component I n=1 Tax=Hyella patelloides LEGE 07179 TaxID=945734 RepID=A0A563VTT6_9CYAN|nr:aminodeoxychorismate synthase component I [Hyella patelloides]VEP14823.1 Aminodeoxychorismate synthase, component I [Hyella patelloides LEGE 07179]
MNQIVIHDAQQKQWLKFTQPAYVVETYNLAEVVAKLQLVNELVQHNKMYAVGFISYEAATAFDDVLVTYESDDFPLLWFGLYQQPEKIDLTAPATPQEYNLNWSPTVTKAEYDRSITQIKQYISCGDTYQVNYTMRLQADFKGDAWKYFQHLTQAQQANYSAYIDLENYAICSASPELFFSWDGNQIVTRPMKGTSARGYTLKGDRKLAQWLHNSAKNRAENVMIVDLIRNDLAKVAELYSVKVPSLFDVEQYPTLWQMTSTVTANTKVSLPEIMKALFPCASITGAPKPRTMEIIRQLEKTPRNIYTGTIGLITPENQAQFNVAIRTVLIDKKAHRAEYGVGGGIVWDSVSVSEYEECQIKARVLLNKNQNFELLETILWTPHEGYFLLDYHLQRLQDTALYFKFTVNLVAIDKQLLEFTNSLQDQPYKVRLMVNQKGNITIKAIPFTPDHPSKTVNLAIAKRPIDLHNPFFYHKTTNRSFYNNIRHKYPNYDDVLLWNERQEITETCIANIVVKRDGKLFTPPVNSGLLAGTFRAYLLEKQEIKEAIIKLKDLPECEAIYLINSVRKWQTAKL